MSRVKDMVIDAHNAEYDTMFSDELIKEYARVSYREGCDEKWQKRLYVILAALRKAVIREASVGTVELGDCEYDADYLLRDKDGKIDMMGYRGVYDLIPHKETT